MRANTVVKKWGNSLGLRLPMSIVKENKIFDGEEFNIETSKDGAITLIPKMDKKYHLLELLEDVNESNLHGETLTGDSVGKEVW
jgi:antitoxin MazE